MKLLNKNLITLFIIFAASCAIAEFSGLPSTAGGSAAETYWHDAGSGNIWTSAPIAKDDGGVSVSLASPMKLSSHASVTNGQAANIGAGGLLYNSALVTPEFSNGTQWVPLSPLQMFGVGGYGLGALNNFVALGVSHANSPVVASHVSCAWQAVAVAADGGTHGVVVAITNDAGVEFCACSVGACTTTIGGCDCTAAVPTGDVWLVFRTVYSDGGVATDCATNPNEMRCNTN